MKRGERLGDLGEDEVVARLLRGFGTEGLLVGPGDDCAVVDEGRGPLRLLKTDAIIEGVHFLPTAAASQVGWKAVARVISDFAAMGGRPRHVLVTLAVPRDREWTWVAGLYRGIRRCLEKHGAVLAGGETSGLPEGAPAMISVAGEGVAERGKCITRGGGREGDVIGVTGRLGGSIAGRHLTFSPRVAEGGHLAAAGVSAMMDLSDGLAKDLPRLAAASGCGYEIVTEALPRHRGVEAAGALGDGEDYELLFTAPPKVWHALVRGWPEGLAPITAIGRLTKEGGSLEGGWDHFK
ncbi:MAG: thiamine-phosphate kinase [Akkermansiaceae bacterium]|jgi:thiamine-monophosphate kinase|nr:thiamine-phosphate kinase [Akkermansiaceae bacterium]